MTPLAGIDRSAPFAPSTDLEARIVDAMLGCISRWGIAKTTADEIAHAAGISRATFYRAFPGGKDVAFEALLRHETRRFFEAATERLDLCTTLEDLLVVGISDGARFLTGHEALGYVLAHEPERVLPACAFHRLDRALAIATAFTAPHLRRFLDDDEVAAVHAEWLVRMVLSYLMNPSPTLDLTDEAEVRRFVATYIAPAIAAGHEPTPATTSIGNASRSQR